MGLRDLSDAELLALRDRRRHGFKTPEVEAEFAQVDPSVKKDILRAPKGILTSAFRTPEANAAVGGIPNSYHTKGKAVDFRLDDKTPERIAYFKEKGYQPILESDHLHVEPGANMPTKRSLRDLSNEELLALRKPRPQIQEAQSAPADSTGVLDDMGAGLRKFTQSATVGLSEPLAAAGSAAIEKFFPNAAQEELNKGKGFKDLYRENRGDLHDSLVQQETTSPIASGVGEVAGYVAPGGAFNRIYKGVNKATKSLMRVNPRLVDKVMQAATAGGLTTAAYEGLHPDQDIRGEDVALGMVAEPVGRAVGAGVSAIGRGLGKAPAKLMDKAVGTTKQELLKGKGIGQEMADRKVFGTLKSLGRQADVGVDRTERALQETLKSKGSINRDPVIGELQTLKKEYLKTPMEREGELKMISDYIDDLLTDPKYDNLSAADANQIKRSLYKQIGEPGFLKDQLPGKKDIIKTKARGLRKAIEEVAPEAKNLNRDLSFYSQLGKRSSREMAGEDANNAIRMMGRAARTAGPTLGGLVFGGPQGAVLAGLGSEAAQTTLGRTSSALILKEIAEALKASGAKVPEFTTSATAGVNRRLRREQR